jgi:hypothetical protein
MMKTTARYLKRRENIERVKAKVCMDGGGGVSNRCEMGGRVRKKGWDVHSNTWDTTPLRQPTKVTLEIKTTTQVRAQECLEAYHEQRIQK